MALSVVPVNSGATGMTNGQMSNQMVSIGELLEFATKKTYRELSLLAELLPRKTDMERKIEIMLFANRNRQLFTRLLALVKWASSASKVDKCSQIKSFLDKQSMWFIETADALARLSRETLVHARLPSFQLLPAVEVFTTGTYSRLPNCIRDRLVPPEPIANTEKLAALQRLNHIIQQRLIVTELPLQMRNIKIEYGRATFEVQNEFKLTLTLMGDCEGTPWRVLNIAFLVEDKETNGLRDLVQPNQVYRLQNYIQWCINDDSRPLVEAYNILHSFCLSLQLEVLHIQSVFLYRERLKEFICIEHYTPGSSICISFWKDSEGKFIHKLIVQIDAHEPFKPLQVKHVPEIDSKLFSRHIQANILSIEKILYFTTQERSKMKLQVLQKLFEDRNENILCESTDLPAILHVSVINSCMSSERLLISVDMLTGHFIAYISQYEDCPILSELEQSLNKNTNKLFTLINDLRIWITRERFRKTVEALPVTLMDSLPFPPNYNHECLNLPGQKIFFQFSRHQDKCLMVIFDNDNASNIWMEFYLICIANVSMDNGQNNRLIGSFRQESPRHYMEITKALHLDSSNIVHTSQSPKSSSWINSHHKRQLTRTDYNSCKRRKLPGYYIAELAHIISFCEEKLSYSALSTELHKQNIHHHIVQDVNGCTHYIEIIKFPTPNTENIQNNTLSCTVRLHGKTSKMWNVLIIFAIPPFQSLCIKENNLRNTSMNCYEFSAGSSSDMNKMIEDLLSDWTAISCLYNVVLSFANDIKYNSTFNATLIEVRSFSYKKIIISYGPSKAYLVSIYYKSKEQRFQLSFGVTSQAQSNTSPHTIVSTQLQQEFNKHLSIVQLLHVLNYTLSPLLTVQNLKSLPFLGVVNSRPQIPVLSFCVIPQSSTHIRLVYRNTYCLDIQMHSDCLVSIRDGALSQFDKSKAIEELNPIQGLKAFLNKFIDKNIQMRRLSQTEDDNPPSPVSTQMDTLQDSSMLSGALSKVSPLKASSVPFSNPHTPASPMPSGTMNPLSNYAPSPGTFSLSSPPPQHSQQQVAHGHVAPSPQMANLDQPSPAGLFSNSPMNSNLHAPSPSAAPGSSLHNINSPASQFLSQNTPGQGSAHDSTGSPYISNQLLSSPASSMWPGSPSVSRPSPRPLSSSLSPGKHGT